MDKYATMYKLAPEGEYELSFEWDDSIITDSSQQLGERLELLAQGIISKAELRKWYFGETQAQAETAIKTIQQEAISQSVDAMLATSMVNGGMGGGTPGGTAGGAPAQ